MREQDEKIGLTVSAVQAYSLVKQCCPGGISPGLLSQQLRDPALLYLDLDALCEMNDEALRELVRPLRTEEDELVPDAQIPEEDGADAAPAEPTCVDECILIAVDSEGLQARMTLIRPPEGIPEAGTRDMLRALYKRKISHGIRMEFLSRLVERPVYDRPFRIAECQQAVDGQDGNVTYQFNPDVDLSPHLSEDGRADYKDLDFVKSVKAGDLLCEITPPTPGVDGVNIFGKPIPALTGRPPLVHGGANTVCSEDGREIRAACDGQVVLQNNAVQVSQILFLDKVDYSTGNISFPGSVHIRGDVASGFTVHAGGDITVQGVVENATLISGRSIVLCSGAKGGGGGLLEAQQDIRTLFIESCKARAGGSIYADTILNSTVECGQKVSVFGMRGYLLGGLCVAGELVSAMEIGNQANIPTAVVLKNLISFPQQEQAVSAAAARYYDMVERLSQLAEEDAGAADLEEQFPREAARIAILSLRLEQQVERMLKEQGQAKQPRRRRMIQAVGTLYPNVTLEINDIFAKNTAIRQSCSVYERQQKLHFVENRR